MTEIKLEKRDQNTTRYNFNLIDKRWFKGHSGICHHCGIDQGLPPE